MYKKKFSFYYFLMSPPYMVVGGAPLPSSPSEFTELHRPGLSAHTPAGPAPHTPGTQCPRAYGSCVRHAHGHWATLPVPSARVRAVDVHVHCRCPVMSPRWPACLPLCVPCARPLCHTTDAQCPCALGLCLRASPFARCICPAAALCAVLPKLPFLSPSAAVTGAVATVHGGRKFFFYYRLQ